MPTTSTPRGAAPTRRAFKLALTRVLNEYGRAKGILKDKDENLSGPDAREGIIAVVSVKLQEAQFEGQTKAKLGNTFIKGLVNNVVYKALTEFFEENPAVAKAILEKRPRLPAPAPPPRRPASWCDARARWNPTVCPASWLTATKKTPQDRTVYRGGRFCRRLGQDGP